MLNPKQTIPKAWGRVTFLLWPNASHDAPTSLLIESPPCASTSDCNRDHDQHDHHDPPANTIPFIRVFLVRPTKKRARTMHASLGQGFASFSKKTISQTWKIYLSARKTRVRSSSSSRCRPLSPESPRRRGHPPQ